MNVSHLQESRLVMDIFTDWILEADILIKHHMASYSIEAVYIKEDVGVIKETVCNILGVIPKRYSQKPEVVMTIITDSPNRLNGPIGGLFYKYESILKELGIDRIEVRELQDHDRIKDIVIDKWRNSSSYDPKIYSTISKRKSVGKPKYNY